MNPTKLVSFLSLFLIFVLLLPACGAKTAYKTDAEPQSVIDAAAAPLSAFSLLSPADSDYVKFRMMLNESNTESYSIYIQNAGSSIDEVGVIQAIGEDPAEVASLVEDYLARRNAEWTGQYLVEEYPKLKNAEYRVFGRYVVYAILSDADKAAFFKDAEAFLTVQ